MAKEYRCSRPVLWLVEKPKTIAKIIEEKSEGLRI